MCSRDTNFSSLLGVRLFCVLVAPVVVVVVVVVVVIVGCCCLFMSLLLLFRRNNQRSDREEVGAVEEGIWQRPRSHA